MEEQPEQRLLSDKTGNGKGAPKGNGNSRTHGLNTLKTAVVKLGGRAIDERYRVGRQLHKWRRELIADLGGQDNISTKQNTLVDIAVKRKLALDSLYACVLTQPTLINKRKKALFPIVLQCEQLADGVSRILAQLGLERRHKVRTIGEILSREHDEHETRTNGAEQGNGTT